MKITKSPLVMLAIVAAFSARGQDLTKDQIQHLADTMLISDGYTVKIKKVLPAANNIQAALVELPYREFPSVLLFSKNSTTNAWTRVFEGLSPGIQENSTDLFNWHTVKPSLGKDFATKDTASNFSGDRVKQLIDAVSFQGIIIPYQNFLHLHTAADPKSHPFAGYTIDKTKYRNFGNQLFKNKYDTYPKLDCSVYNSPAIDDLSLEFKDNTYTIVARTGNKQQWTYTFSGVDDQARYLENKTIVVQQLK